MSDQKFDYDVYLAHATAEKAAVRELAQRLKRAVGRVGACLAA